MSNNPTLLDIALQERIAQVLYREDVAEPLSEWADVHPVARTSYGRRATRVIEALREDYAIIPIGSVPDWMEDMGMLSDIASGAQDEDDVRVYCLKERP